MTSSPKKWRHQKNCCVSMFLIWWASIVVSFIIITIASQKLCWGGRNPPPPQTENYKKSPGRLGLTIKYKTIINTKNKKLAETCQRGKYWKWINVNYTIVTRKKLLKKTRQGGGKFSPESPYRDNHYGSAVCQFCGSNNCVFFSILGSCKI